MGSTGSSSKVKSLISALSNYDPRFGQDVIKAGEKFHREFPEFPEITRVYVTPVEGVASMNGLGMLNLNPKYLNRGYDYETSDIESKDEWLAGDPTYEKSVVSHELGHNLDIQFSRFLSERTPETYNPQTIVTDAMADALSTVTGKKVNLNDTFSFPTSDTKATVFTIDGTDYSYSSFLGTDNGRFSDIFVPLAIKNIQRDWKQLGFARQPTESELLGSLSGYAYWSKYNQSDVYLTEVFAECYADHASHGKNANILSREVMRLTKSAYSQLVKRKKNTVHEFMNKLMDASFGNGGT